MATSTSAKRIDCVFIRKSTQAQDEQGQIANVQNMLRDQGASVPEGQWFVGTVSRRKVRKNADFARLMELIEADRVGTVYIESQDRWGSADRKELFHLLYILEQHSTRLFDLRAKKDLTEGDFATEMLTIVGSLKSEKELQDISYRSLRTRVSNFRDNGSWPTGTHPFGYGKACYSPTGKLLWVFQPISRSRGRVSYADADGNLVLGQENVKIPRKDKRDKIILIPNDNSRYVEAVRTLFDLYVRVGLSRRAISKELNLAGFKFYDKPFRHPDTTNILTNPAYVGDTHFGKRLSGELHTFDANGIVVPLTKHSAKRNREESERIIRENTHEGLIDRAIWKAAQQKLADEQESTNFSPRNPAYYLKQLFRCGHCGKNLTGRMETVAGGQRKPIYVCSTYIAGKCNGHPVECGYHRISHDDAERLLLEKVQEMGLDFDFKTSDLARMALRDRLVLVGYKDEEAFFQWSEWVGEGIDALLEYLERAHYAHGEELQRLAEIAARFYDNLKTHDSHFDGLTVTAEQFAKAVRIVEARSVAQAKGRMADLQEEHSQLTLGWAKASEMMQAVLKEQLDRIEQEINEVRPRTTPLSERVAKLGAAERDRQKEREHITAEWPRMEAREKGEALRRLFKTVTLYWERTYHHAMKKPTRPRKTNRPGRYSYALQKARIKWEFTKSSDLEVSW